MIGAREILAGTRIEDQYLYFQEEASLDEKLGFLTLRVPFNAPRREILLGFGVPGWQLGDQDLPGSTHSVTEFDELPESQRTLRNLHMGVGVRLHNTWQGVTAMPEGFQRVGAYMLGFDPSSVHPMLKITREGQLFDRILQGGASRLVGLENVIRTVHRWQGEVDLTSHSLPEVIASSEHRQPPLAGIDERLMIVRNPNIVLTKVGEIQVGDGLH